MSINESAVATAISEFKGAMKELSASENIVTISKVHDKIAAICRIASRCESPIESLVFWEFLISGMTYVVDNYDMIGGLTHHRFAKKNLSYRLSPQFGVVIDGKNYRCDFAISVVDGPENEVGKICIELDGHEFHERTKEQAQRDKSRDRNFQKAGFVVLRYTGSEVWNNPCVVIDDVERVIEDMSLKMFGRTDG